MAGLAFSVNYFKRATDASFDTVLGVFFAIVVAAGIVILSRGGGFAKYSRFLIGDILTITPGEIAGVLQVNAVVPQGVGPGPVATVMVSVGGIASQAGVTIAVM